MGAATAHDKLRTQIDERKTKITEARIRDQKRRERYNMALETAEKAVREHAAQVLPCERFGRIPEPPRGLTSWPDEPASEVRDIEYSTWIAASPEFADASLEASLRQIEAVRAATIARLDHLACCAKCRVFFRCVALSWLFKN